MKQAAILVGSGIGAVIISALTVGAFAVTIPLAMAGNALAGRSAAAHKAKFSAP